MAIDTKELMKHVRRIKVFTTKLVDEHISGEYHSVFKGRGMEFDEVRAYVPGDDVRSIDWNVTARMGHLFVKRFCEERELTIMFLVDISGSMCFGSQARSKAEVAAELTCLLALSAIKNQDKVGMILFSDRIERFIPPRKGRTAVMRLVREVLAAEETRRPTEMGAALQFLNKVQKRRAVVFMISDFMAGGYENELRVAAQHHDLIACPVSDPREQELENIGLQEILDPETGQLFLLDTGSRLLRDAFRQRTVAEEEARNKLLKKLRVDTIGLSTDRPFADDVRRLFHQRQRRKARG
ncbi:MAG: DUF58 domain-containing protein [Verrucomicrobia bacterium]|nr:DUF58 domain-containing protein [Verrucomicrobiota bacterium]MBU4247413.1 DUF58 domain-containing protein [Verrucomicrobiota bacterium]MBU4290951.1 DUF58 domain-containing protein [Verrucomicrobiota bacterium]MBU4497796.1 DUF58 domain-containing protein [Verrucomicrobiota bacterium]MCG2681673.1 DUF58 domain-containing protein [Kiritimatiellia bacterium]